MNLQGRLTLVMALKKSPPNKEILLKFRFNKSVELPVFTDAEYVNHLTVDGWTRGETEHLLDLCGRFDLRFPVIYDRWDSEKFKMSRTVEDLKVNAFL